MKKIKYLPAIPPEDYTGTVSGWMTKLIEEGLWDGVFPEWYGDINIPEDKYWQMIEELEQ